jgi:transcriptional regulator with XRE-family HTH domain
MMEMRVAHRICSLRLDAGLSRYGLARAINIERKTIMCYEDGKGIPGGKRLALLARYFGVSSDYILCLNDLQHDLPSELSLMELDLVALIRKLKVKEKEMVRAFLDNLYPE